MSAARDSRRAVRWGPAMVPAPGRTVPVRVYRPRPARGGWLVWAHGGSWRAGSLEGWHLACAHLARQASCTVVSVDYRLAPQCPHPAALTDVLAVLAWAESESLRTGPCARVAVGGDSAGGTIAACAALVWRDRKRPLTAQVLAYPPLDPQCAAPSYSRHPDSFPHRAELIEAWRDYRGGGCAPAASALYSTPFEAADLTGLAPAIIGTGTLDPVSDDARAYAALLLAAGNEVELREFPQLGHGAFLSDGALRRWLGAALSRRTA